MTLPSELVAEFAKITNDGKDSRKEVTVYGTISVQNGVNYVKLDGSDELTPVTSTVSIKDGERVIVTLKQHTAVVTSNLTTPSIGTREYVDLENGLTTKIEETASGIRTEMADSVNGLRTIINETASGIRAEITDTKNELSTTITAQAGHISTLVSNGKEFSKFQQTVEGFLFEDEEGSVKIDGGSIRLTGAIVWDDLNDEMQTLVNAINNTADTAAKDVTSVKSSLTSLEEALADKITSGAASTLITETLVSSPVIQGGRISGSVFSNLDATTWIEIGKDASGTNNDAWALGVFGGQNFWGQYDDMIFGVYNGDLEYTSFSGKNGYSFLITDGGENTSMPQGTWDFSDATVTGLTISGGTTTAVFA